MTTAPCQPNQKREVMMSRNWIPLCVIAGFYLLAGAVAPPIEALMGVWS